jgi:hypothetical protein
MKIREIIREDADDSDSDNAELIQTLLFLKQRYEDKGMPPEFSTSSVLQSVQNLSGVRFSYGDLVAAHESDEAVKNLIKSVSKDSISLTTDADEDDDFTADDDNQAEQDPEAVVGGMAKKALNNRS